MISKPGQHFDAVLLTAFGGPEKKEDVLPYLARVTQGRVPEQRLKVVARHYDLFGGKSPVKEITFQQADALEKRLRGLGLATPVYVGMRHWHPLLPATLSEMAKEGIQKIFVIVMSVFQSLASWDQYKHDVAESMKMAQVKMTVAYGRPMYDRPGFIDTMARNIANCLQQISQRQRQNTTIVFTAHSIPHTDPHVEQYARQMEITASGIMRRFADYPWRIAYQSRSGRPQDPWLEPDVNAVIADLADERINAVVIAPVGFVCDNIEVLYDLGTQARKTAQKTGLTFQLAKTVGTNPTFIDTLAELVTKKRIG